MNSLEHLSPYFDSLATASFASLQSEEELTLKLDAEDQDYVRFNGGRIRQATSVQQIRLKFDFQTRQRRVSHTVTLTGQINPDTATARSIIDTLRQQAAVLPPDPWVMPLQNHGTSHSHHPGNLTATARMIEDLTQSAQGSDFTGLLAQGSMVRANRNALGQNHWFSCANLLLDYSLYTVNVEGQNKAVKGFYADTGWDRDRYAAQLAGRQKALKLLERGNRHIAPGEYRVYLAPAAVDDLIGMLSWDGSSYRAFREGRSALGKLAEGTAHFSPLFTLKENFGLGLSPRFNSLGEMPQECLSVIEQGRLGSLLISSRSAAEYGVTSNGADPGGEGLRSPDLMPGDLPETEVLQALDTGLYLGNLHYLNWSDVQTARVTGMTRYACFWVEGGEIVAPIGDLRFDESLYRIFGSELLALTTETELCLSTDTYGQRSLGGSRVPGALIGRFRFTL